MKRLNAAAMVLLGSLVCACLPLTAAAPPQNTAQSSTESSTNPPHSWTIDQAATASVREAWQMGGKTEQGFFQIVQALIQLDAQKRGITMPDDADAGAKVGKWIKKQAKKDPDQLLYAVVDRAVQHSVKATTATK